MLTMTYVANAKQGGISTFILDQEKGTLSEVGAILTEFGIAPLATSPNRRCMYAAIHSNPPSVAAFIIDSKTGMPHLLNNVECPAPATYLTVDATGRFLLGASYSGNTAFVLAIGRDGFIQSEPVCVLAPGRNPHCVRLDASNRFAFMPLLGNDTVALFQFDQNTGMLSANNPALVAAERESGPRHIELSPDNRYAFVNTEMGGDILTYALNNNNGTLVPLHSVPVLPSEKAFPKGTYTPPVNSTGGPNSVSPVMWTAELRVTPDNRFLYASERTGSTITCFRVDPVSARLDVFDVVETEKQPRGFTVDPLGKHLIVAGEKSDHVSVYSIDSNTGILTQTERKQTASSPTWVECLLL